jgi:hypothetical protein
MLASGRWPLRRLALGPDMLIGQSGPSDLQTR